MWVLKNFPIWLQFFFVEYAIRVMKFLVVVIEFARRFHKKIITQSGYMR